MEWVVVWWSCSNFLFKQDIDFYTVVIKRVFTSGLKLVYLVKVRCVHLLCLQTIESKKTFANRHEEKKNYDLNVCGGLYVELRESELTLKYELLQTLLLISSSRNCANAT